MSFKHLYLYMNLGNFFDLPDSLLNFFKMVFTEFFLNSATKTFIRQTLTGQYNHFKSLRMGVYLLPLPKVILISINFRATFLDKPP